MSARIDGFYLSARWFRLLATVRLLLAVAAMVLGVAGWPGNRTLTMLAGAYAAYCALALTPWLPARRPLVSLLIDTAAFMLVASLTSPVTPWIGTAFYVYLLLSAAFQLSWREVWMVVVACMAFYLIARPAGAERSIPLLSMVGILASALALEKRALLERLQGASAETAFFQNEAEQAREQERQRIANDFHDGPLQSFISLQMRLEFLRHMLDRSPATARDELLQVQDLLKNQVGELRAWLRGMRPIQMEGNFSTAVRRLVDEFKKDSGIATSLYCPELKEAAETESSIEILQILREALNNVQKHSKASRVEISVEKASGILEIAVEDDGTGYPFAGSFSGEELETLRLGPASIRRRVRTLGGDLLVESRPGRGAAVKVRVPA